MLILHLLAVYLLETAAKVQKLVRSLKKLDFITQASTKSITLRPLVTPSLCWSAIAQGIQAIISVDPCVLKSNYYLALSTIILLRKLAGVETNLLCTNWHFTTQKLCEGVGDNFWRHGLYLVNTVLWGYTKMI